MFFEQVECLSPEDCNLANPVQRPGRSPRTLYNAGGVVCDGFLRCRGASPKPHPLHGAVTALASADASRGVNHYLMSADAPPRRQIIASTRKWLHRFARTASPPHRMGRHTEPLISREVNRVSGYFIGSRQMSAANQREGILPHIQPFMGCFT